MQDNISVEITKEEFETTKFVNKMKYEYHKDVV